MCCSPACEQTIRPRCRPSVCVFFHVHVVKQWSICWFKLVPTYGISTTPPHWNLTCLMRSTNKKKHRQNDYEYQAQRKEKISSFVVVWCFKEKRTVCCKSRYEHSFKVHGLFVLQTKLFAHPDLSMVTSLVENLPEKSFYSSHHWRTGS